ncbi:unnamed protein product [Cryptosporidium hominis]|uniref:SbmA/BacA-like protein n=1 Tax=Cryptosporidium hominis TaxID=237895 RepID=A0A0S4TIA1_CRYHO|nr:hypothetical protein [Cryptosporidium hominis TU502]OLQ17808.1 SbmA/BacA-like family [Cryptosporidium hominis]PPA64231.1 SbmA/BacA-like family protein [Cryptosporidium hominis]PPS94864.1 SbmA/BacA-like protein [Cryptosporidium hominis]CUV07118.1 unnamed protein product [Cryptosporidium hominis]|eukprot:PPS94864.1 SbmA/BacA-like protein [Cryptosporidium hominis]
MILFSGLSRRSLIKLFLFLAAISACSVLLLYLEFSGNSQLKTFGDVLQAAVKDRSSVSASDLYTSFFALVSYKLAVVFLKSVSSFLSKKSIFFWRLQLTEYFLENWENIYLIEGVSQRIQEDTMRYCRLFEKFSIFVVQDLFKLFIYLPLLLDLSKHITRTWFIPNTRHLLLVLIIINSIIGTSIIIFPSKYLSRLVYNIDKEEAAFRKNLVLFELEERDFSNFDFDGNYNSVDNTHRSYYRRYYFIKILQLLHFRLSMITYWLFAHPSMVPPYTLGLLKQTMHAFDEVSSVFNFVVSHFKSLIEYIAVFLRLNLMVKQTKKAKETDKSGICH